MIVGILAQSGVPQCSTHNRGSRTRVASVAEVAWDRLTSDSRPTRGRHNRTRRVHLIPPAPNLTPATPAMAHRPRRPAGKTSLAPAAPPVPQTARSLMRMQVDSGRSPMPLRLLRSWRQPAGLPGGQPRGQLGDRYRPRAAVLPDSGHRQPPSSWRVFRHYHRKHSTVSPAAHGNGLR